jgi:hypothetical protein
LVTATKITTSTIKIRNAAEYAEKDPFSLPSKEVGFKTKRGVIKDDSLISGISTSLDNSILLSLIVTAAVITDALVLMLVIEIPVLIPAFEFVFGFVNGVNSLW